MKITIPDHLRQKISFIIDLASENLSSHEIGKEKILKEIKILHKEFENINKPVKLFDADPEEIYLIATISDRLKIYDQSKFFYRFFINLNPTENLDVAWNNLGLALQNLNKVTEAESSFRSAISMNENNINAWFNLGKLLLNLKRFSRAETIFKKILEFNQDNVQALIGLGGISANLGKYDEAQEILKKVLQLSETSSENELEAKYGLALIFEHDKSYEEALDMYNGIIGTNPMHVDAWNRVGIIYLDYLKQIDKAKNAFKKILSLDESNSPAWNNLGLVLKRQGKNSEAEKAYRKSIDNNPDYALAYNNLGVLLKDTKRFEEAENYFEKAVTLDPTNSWAKSNLEFIQQTKSTNKKNYKLDNRKKIY